MSKTVKALLHCSAVCNIWVERFLAALGITMALVVILQVICRYVFNSSLFWSEELARYLLVWLAFLGTSSGYHRRIHPSIDILPGNLKKTTVLGIVLAGHGIAMCFFVVMIYHGTIFAYFVRLQISPALALPKWIVFSVIPLSGCLLLLHCLAFLASDIAAHRHDR